MNTIDYVSIVLKDTSGKLWISKRNNSNKIMYGKYQCPGGHIEKESQLNAVVRELHEETNLIPNDTLKFIFEYNFNVQDDIYDNGLRRVYVYEMITNEIPQNTEPTNHDDWKLMTKKELKKLPIIETLKVYLEFSYKNPLKQLSQKILSQLFNIRK